MFGKMIWAGEAVISVCRCLLALSGQCEGTSAGFRADHNCPIASTYY